MGIVSFVTDTAGQVGVNPRRVKMVTTDTLAAITTAGYLNSSVLSTYAIYPTDIFDVDYLYVIATGASTYGEFSPSIVNGVITLVASSSSDIVLPTIANHIATYTNTTGGLSEDPATAISGGNIQAGLSGTAGTLASFPATASKGSLVVAAVANTGNTVSTISNDAMGQASVISVPDPGNAAGQFLVGATATPFVSGNFPQNSGTAGLMVDSGIPVNTLGISAIASPDAASDLIWHDVTCGFAALATAGKVNIQLSSGSKQYKVRDIRVNYSASGLSGGGGDRLLAITDGTTVYNNAGITAALLGTPVNTVWGGTGNPLPGTVAMNTSSVAAANIYAQYSGGTTDYTSGSVIISVLVQRVA